MKKNPAVRGAVVIGITLLVFGLLVRNISFTSISEKLASANLSLILLGVVISILYPLILSIRWKLVSQQIGLHISLWTSLKVVLGVWPFNVILPSKTGDLVKAYIFKSRIKMSATTGAIFAERIFDLAVLASFSIIGLIMTETYKLLPIPIAMICLTVIALFTARTNLTIMRDGKWETRIKNVLLALKKLSTDHTSLFKILMLTVASWVVSVVQVFIFFLAFGIDIPITLVAANVPLAIFVGIIPLTLAGMGTRESAMIFLFAGYADAATTLSVGLLYSFCGYWLFAVLGLPFTRTIFKKKSIALK